MVVRCRSTAVGIASAVLSVLILPQKGLAQTAPSATPPSSPSSAAAAGAPALREITVSAQRSERPIEDVPAIVTTQDAADIERNQVRSIRELDRYETDVSVQRSPTRFTAAGASVGRAGNEGFNIRGLEGNRVLIQIDGVRVPSSFAFGANAFGRDWLDVGTLKRVEILRGPASTLYGSDGLAGVVSFYTFDPADLLAKTGNNTYLTAGIGWSQEDRSFTKTLGAAGRYGDWEAMLYYTRRDGHELSNRGDNDAPNVNRTKPNPQEYGSDSVLAKVVYRLSPTNRLRLTADVLDRNVSTNALSAIAVPPLAATSAIGLTAQDETRRVSVMFDQSVSQLGWSFADSLRWNVYSQNARARQIAYEDRFTAADRVRDTRYREHWVGGGAVLERGFDTGPVGHKLVYGFDVAQAKYESLRDGLVPPAGETFPAKAFPDTKYNLYGVFAQDEIALLDGKFSVIPGLRWDGYRYQPTTDALYGRAVSSASDSHVSPRLGLVWRLAAGHSLFANVSRGFRAPTADQLNNGFANTVANYQSIANPNLKPETSQSFEVGARKTSRDLNWTVSAFDGRYKDFIDQRQVRGTFTVADPAIFQYINVGQVKIRGIEGQVSYRFLPQWRAMAGFGFVRGDNESTNRPLNSVDPFKLVTGLDWDVAGGATLGLRVVHVGAKKDSRIDSASLVTAPATQYATGAYTTIDLLASWQVTKMLRLSGGILNLTDKKYARWTDVRGLSSSSPVLDAYTQPGRALSLNARIEL